MGQRSSYPKSFKPQVVQECLQPEATISSVAVNHGINANVIRIDSIWIATQPMDMRAGTDTARARVIAVFGAAKPHCAYQL